MAAKGRRVTGLDISPQMLEIARESARENGVSVSWVQADMSRLKLAERFDCVTCFFDSLNYLLKAEELARAFQAVSAHLNPGGWFIFDMNTIYGLAVSWQRFPYNLIEDTADYLELMGTSYDYELNIADVRFIMFEREGERWSRYEEVHRERGYHLDDILLMLEQAGLKTGHVLGEPLTLRPLAESDGRVWITAQKPGKPSC
jgi:SAM-dependent methyltransferase